MRVSISPIVPILTLNLHTDIITSMIGSLPRLLGLLLTC